jgi:predicted site-specific integrase-resolvase
MTMVIYAYLRVSSDKQDIHNQRHGILEYANMHTLSPIHFIEDTISGREKWESRGIGSLLTLQALLHDQNPCKFHLLLISGWLER